MDKFDEAFDDWFDAGTQIDDVGTMLKDAFLAGINVGIEIAKEIIKEETSAE